MAQKLDLRIIKTEREIKKAFLALLQKKDFEKITINDIAQEALVGKVTFYNHYADKYDLADKIVQEKLKQYKDLLHKRVNIVSHSNFKKPSFNDFLPKAQYLLSEFAILSKIHTSEINFESQVKKTIAQEYKHLIQNTPQLKIKDPSMVAQLLAAVAFEYFERYIKDTHQPNPKILNDQLSGLIQAINYFFRPKT